MSARIELPDWINPTTCERGYAMARLASSRMVNGRPVSDWDIFHAGVRAARAQDPKLLLALEGMLRAMDRTAEHQWGEYRRSSSTPWSERVEATEVQLVREGLAMAADGYTNKFSSPEEWAKRLEHFGWIYAGAAITAGLIYPRPYMVQALASRRAA